MNIYEITYQQGEKTDSALVKAEGPVAAERAFLAAHPEEGLKILCVVRQ